MMEDNASTAIMSSGRTNWSTVDSDAEEGLMSAAAYMWTAVYLILLSVTGFIMNLMVAVIIIKDKMHRTPLNLILLNLACSDACIATIGAPMSAEAALNHGWHYGEAVCVAYALMMSTTGIASITTLSILALWRCSMVVMPLKKWDMGHRQAAVIIAIIWAYSLAVTLPPLFGWGRYGLEAAHISCSVDWQTSVSNTKSYILYMFFWGLIFPLAIILISYGSIVRAIQQSKVRTNVLPNSANAKAQKRVTVMVGAMICAFMLAWMPYSVVALIETFSVADQPLISPAAATVPSIFAKASSILNPIIYGIFNTQFRSSWSKLFHVKRTRDPATGTIDGGVTNGETPAGGIPSTQNSLMTLSMYVQSVRRQKTPDERRQRGMNRRITEEQGSNMSSGNPTVLCDHDTTSPDTLNTYKMVVSAVVQDFAQDFV